MKSYEQKYKEALGWMKSLYGGLHGKTKEEAEKYFPELAESEDGRIRKVLIDYFKRYKEQEECGIKTFYGIPTDDILAWLEKQGETFTKKDVEDAYLQGISDTKNELEKQGEQKPIDKVEPKFKVKYAGNEYNVFETKDIAGVTFYGIEDEPNHIDYVKAENCDIISVYAIKENGSPYPTKPAVFSEKKPKRMISAEAKECIYGSDNEQVSSEKIGKNDTLYDLLNKMPSYITVDGIFYHFILRKTALAYTAYYAGEEEGSGKVIFVMTAFSPIDLLAEMLEKLKEKGLLE